MRSISRATRATTGLRFASAKAAGVTSRVCAILGSQWGDEGKGKLADVLAKKCAVGARATRHPARRPSRSAPPRVHARSYDIVARFNGGANAGHTVVVGDKKYAFHLLPCGVIYPHTTNLLGNGTVIHLESLFGELAELDGAGISHAGRVLISDRAHLLFDFHKRVDGLLEERRANASGKIGTTKQGIGPCYAAKATRNGIRAGMLAHRGSLKERLARLVADTSAAFSVDIDGAAEWEKLDALRERVLPMVVDGVQLVNGALASGKRLITEGANAALLDMDFGTVRAARRRSAPRPRRPADSSPPSRLPCAVPLRDVEQHVGGRHLHGTGHRTVEDRLGRRRREGVHDARGRRALPDGADGRARRRRPAAQFAGH